MKTIFSTFCLALTLALSLAAPNVKSRADVIDETNLEDGYYTIQSLLDNRLIGAMVNGDGNIETWMGNVTTEEPSGDAIQDRKLVWRSIKDEYPYEDAIYLTRHVLTVGPNRFNNFDFELPSGNGSFPVNRLWRLRNLGEGVVAINNVPFFNFGLDDDTCAQNNGHHEDITFQLCDEKDVRQQWKFVVSE